MRQISNTVERTITLKLPDALAARLRAAVQRRSRTQSEVVRTALESHLDAEATFPGSCLDLARDLAGSVSGPPDLSSSRRQLRGYGRS
jgi:Arc/MetJ-type ribon-helix-helix transcriptional regulator